MRKIATAMTIVAGLAVVVAPVVAQVGTEVRERPAFQGRGMMGGGPAARVQNPAALVLERRAELGLTSEQVRQIEAIQARVQQENASRIEQLRAAFGDRTDRNFRDLTVEERQQLRERMQQLQPVRQQLRETNRAAGQEIHALLTAEQQEQLRTLRRDRMREFRSPRGPRGPRGDGEWQNRRGEKRGAAEGRRHYRGMRGGGL
jgi:hypothetical protein